MDKKILILPSWYPNKTDNNGTFFREQAYFLSNNGFDLKVLMIQELHTKNYVFHRLKRFFKGIGFQLSQNYLSQEPAAFSYPVIIQKSWSIEKKLLEVEKGYLKAFDTLTNSLNWHPDIIHLQGMYKLNLSSYVIAEKYKIPMVVIEHSPFKLSNYETHYLTRIEHIYKIARRVAGVSNFHKKCLSSINYKRDLEVVWNLTDEQKFLYNPSAKTTDVFIITSILRAESVKDPITLFDSILRFFKEYDGLKPFEVNVVGISSLEELASMKGMSKETLSRFEAIQHILKFHTWLGREKILKLHQKSSVYVSTSIVESFGLAVRESMLCGTPVISTKSGGPEDIVCDGAGILVDIGDYVTIAENLLSIYRGNIIFNNKRVREQVIGQSGCNAFLKRMEKFYIV